MKKPIKEIYDLVELGSKIVIDDHVYQLEEAMILGTSEFICVCLKFISDNRMLICSADTGTNHITPLSNRQRELCHKIFQIHNSRFMNSDMSMPFNYKAISSIGDDENAVEEIVREANAVRADTKISVGSRAYSVNWFSMLYDQKGNSLVVSIPEEEMVSGLSVQPLYRSLKLSSALPDYVLYYQGNIVRIEKRAMGHLLYIQPYSIEIMQSTQCKSLVFENISNLFSVLDFVVNHSDSDVEEVVYPNSNEKPIHNYIVVGELKNIEIDIEDCIIGNVRVGNSIDVSEEFEKSIADLSEESITVVWVDIKADSLYNAFSAGKRLLASAADFLTFMIKNDMYADWYGAVEIDSKVWDIRSHSPKISLGPVFYVENCILGDSLTITDENGLLPNKIMLDENSEYLFEYDWIESFFRELQNKNKKVLRLQYALNWIVQAWNTDDIFDRVIYCSMALEFIVNGEKGKNIFDEYAVKAGRDNFTKSERKVLINSIIEKIKIEEIDGFSQANIDAINESISKMVRSRLTEVSFGTKLNLLISRLGIPMSGEEKELLNKARKIRNELIHGLDMSGISTLEIKKLCGVTSRILMYKLMDILRKE